MMTKMWSQRRTMWIATGAGIVMLTLGAWFMTGLERHQVLPPDEKTSDQSQTEAFHGGKQCKKGRRRRKGPECAGREHALALLSRSARHNSAMSISRQSLLYSLDTLLQPEKFKDYGPNGLQVEGKEPVSLL